MAENRELNGDVNEEPEGETEQPYAEEEQPDTASEPEEEMTPDTVGTAGGDMAQVDIVTGSKRMVMSAPVKEFDEFKTSFKAMMVAFGNFIEAAGLEIGKDETGEKLSAMSDEIEKLREELAAEEDKVGAQMVTRDELDTYKAENEAKMTQEAEDYVRREEFERFRQAIREVI